MDAKKIFDIIQEQDPEVYDKVSPRRHILKSFTSKVAVAALPLALGSMFKKAYGKTNDLLYESLAFALTLEYLEADFYTAAVDAIDFFPVEAHASIMKLQRDEAAHVKFLTDFLMSTAGIVPDKPVFDFTGGSGSRSGPFADVFTNYLTFLSVAQVFEDTGVRAYKGQAPVVYYNSGILSAALKIHSVEARHAAHIRTLRRKATASLIKPWITEDNSDIQSNYTQSAYADDDLYIQNGITLTNINGYSVSNEQVSQAFDEPMHKDIVMEVIRPFLFS